MCWAGKAVTRTGLRRGELAGRVSVVAGAGRGVGREVAFALAYLGVAVVVADVSYESVRTVDEICSAGGRSAAINTDVSREDHVNRLARSTRNLFGPADIIVNNVIVAPASSGNCADAELQDGAIVEDERSASLICRACLPEMLERGSGIIVNMVSTGATPCPSAYHSTKQCFTEFSRSLADEVGAQGVRVVTLSLGMVSSPSEQGAGGEPQSGQELTEDRFFGSMLHPAYDGLMSPEYAGAAAAYLVCKLADEYHGDVVTGCTVLERAGLIDGNSTKWYSRVEPDKDEASI